jgi:uncharacterized protein DUF3443
MPSVDSVIVRRLVRLLPIGVLALAVGCGGGSSSSSSSKGGGGGGTTTNVQAITVNSGPAAQYVNGVFASVTVCVPGTSTCQTIDGVLVDTGSYGLRLVSSAVTISLPQQTDASANPVGECAQFSDGVTWGSVNTGDIKIAGETASSVPIQVINPNFSAIPSGCTALGTPEETVSTLLANGILGVGPFAQDCGIACTTSGNVSPPSGTYYICPASGCVSSFEPLASQVQNPVPLFATDNNGVLVALLTAPGANGAVSISGSLIFGIGTQSNNGLGSAKVYTINGNANFTTIYKDTAGQSHTYTNSFIDSGSNAYFFPDSGIPVCSSSSSAPGFYCPTSTLNLSATNQGANAASGSVSFSVANAVNLVSGNPGNFVFGNLGGANIGSTAGFDWGLPFFYGRNVYVAIEGASTPGGTGPYWAY